MIFITVICWIALYVVTPMVVAAFVALFLPWLTKRRAGR